MIDDLAKLLEQTAKYLAALEPVIDKHGDDTDKIVFTDAAQNLAALRVMLVINGAKMKPWPRLSGQDAVIISGLEGGAVQLNGVLTKATRIKLNSNRNGTALHIWYATPWNIPAGHRTLFDDGTKLTGGEQ
jgi:hypothetical protein